MTEYHLDTNVLIHLLVQQTAPEIETIRHLFGEAARGRCTLTLHEAVVAETVHVLKKQFEFQREAIGAALLTVARTEGVECVAPERVIPALQMFRGVGLDFVDCLLAAASNPRWEHHRHVQPSAGAGSGRPCASG